MKELRRKKMVRQWVYSPLTVGALLLVVFVFGRACYNLYGKERESATRLQEASIEKTNLTSRQASLQKDISSLKTPEGVEFEIKDNFRMVKNGESLAIIVDPNSTSTKVNTKIQGGQGGR